MRTGPPGPGETAPGGRRTALSVVAGKFGGVAAIGRDNPPVLRRFGVRSRAP
ncbi:hypothetical protein JCM4814A_47560 [Streptomyces phaeofaciens JCM 4814]|uniref:Uncharacterized protein n=1 Tax=Streptomyces phaeofaciens TaxID=68254 RepID=A0A918LPC1_9ACTN|nr:hypothetical protein GCM10010226_04220 [Streptomyces phaeofaciens]